MAKPRATKEEMNRRVERAMKLVRAGGTIADIQLKMGLSRYAAREVWGRAHVALGGTKKTAGKHASAIRSHEYTTCSREIGEAHTAGLDDIELQRHYAAVRCLLLGADELLPKVRSLMREQDKQRMHRMIDSVTCDFSYPSNGGD